MTTTSIYSKTTRPKGLRKKLIDPDHQRKRTLYIITKGRYTREVGTKREVVSGTAFRTKGWNVKQDFIKNPRGKYVSKKRREQGLALKNSGVGIFATDVTPKTPKLTKEKIVPEEGIVLTPEIIDLIQQK